MTDLRVTKYNRNQQKKKKKKYSWSSSDFHKKVLFEKSQVK